MKEEMMLDVIAQMERACIGRPAKWKKMARKVRTGLPLTPAESEYYSRLTRTYKDPETARVGSNRRYHFRLSEGDDRPRCSMCEADSEYYCHMNDQYFCQIHVVGHDYNE